VAVWATYPNKGLHKAWDCRECEADAAKKLQRGSCGGPFLPTLGGVRVLDMTIPGSQVLDGPRDDSLLDYRFSSCPIAESRSPWLGHAYQCWQSWRKGSLDAVCPAPSAPLLDLITTFEHESNALERRVNEDRVREMKARAAESAAKAKSKGGRR